MRRLSGTRAVADVAVFGVPHEEWGEEVKAVVEPVGRRARPELTAELLAFLQPRVARFSSPASIRRQLSAGSQRQSL